MYSHASQAAEDVVMGTGSESGKEESDDEGTTVDGKSDKKKKSQRFYCNEYPPCTLSFTRSEHLARHIRCDSLRLS